MSLFIAATAALVVADAYLLRRFLQSRKKPEIAAKASLPSSAMPPHAQADCAAVPGKMPAPNVSLPIVLKHDLHAMEEELLSLRARLNNHEITHLSDAERKLAPPASFGEIAKAIDAARAENFSQLTQAAVEISAMHDRIAELEKKLGITPPSELPQSRAPQGAAEEQARAR